MRIISYNVNGIRSAMSKGLVDWMKVVQPDILCLQEIKASPEQVGLLEFEEMGYQTYWYPAQKKGYSGVAIFTKLQPLKVELKHMILKAGLSEQTLNSFLS
jgi:exodeoxyribonuclease-3